MTSAQVDVASEASRRSRRRFVPVVDARFQWKYTLIISGIGVGIAAIMGWFLYSAHQSNTVLLELEGNLALQQEIMRSDRLFLLTVVVGVIAMGLALAFWGLIVTHRISGPLYIVARYLSTLADGRYPDLRPLRKRDELHELFAALEAAVGAMRSRDEHALEQVERALDDAARAGDAEPKVALEKTVQALTKQRDQLRQALDR